MKKSIFLSLVTILIMGGTSLASSDILRVATAGSIEDGGITENICNHENKEYVNLGMTHNVNCIDCGGFLDEEAHVDVNNDMCCDACLIGLSSLAPSEGEGYVESEITLNESIKISINANESEVSSILVSSWYDKDAEKIYESEAIFNPDTGLYEVEIHFGDVNGANGIYNFDAAIYDANGNMRYVRISEIDYTKNGISKVTTNRTSDGDIELTIEAIEGGEIFIGINGEKPTEESEWITYEAGETYTVEDNDEEVKALNVYYANDEITEETLAPTTFSVLPRSIDPTTFITNWSIPNDNTEIILPVLKTGINLTVDWGDGSAVENVTEELYKHTYSLAGDYLITISGTCRYFGNPDTIDISTDSDYYTYTTYLTEVISWGELYTEYSFTNCRNLVSVSDNYTSSTFFGCTSFANMFYGCTSLESLDFSNANVIALKNIRGMFYNATNLKYVNLNNIDLSNIKFMVNVFENCENLEEVYLNVKFTNSELTNMAWLFANCKKLTYIDLSAFDTTNVIDMNNMFNGCESLETIIFNNFNTSSVTNMTSMFANCTSLVDLNISNFNTSSVTNMNSMFTNCMNLTNLNLTNFDTSKVTDMDNMFNGCEKLETLDVSSFDTSSLITMKSMFNYCKALNTLDITNFDTNSVIDMSFAFNGCRSLKSILLSNKFIIPTECEKIMLETDYLNAIILVDDTPTSNQFTAAKDELSEKYFYVPSLSSEQTYENSLTVFSEENIKPILELVGEKEKNILLRKPYEEQYYTVAGFEIANSGDYMSNGYQVYMDGEVNVDVPGTYEITYSLFRYIDGNSIEIMSETRKVIVSNVIVTPPTKFTATEGLEENVVIVSWRDAEGQGLKYELWGRSETSEWQLLDADAHSEYNHTGLDINTNYEYRIRSYNEEGYYSEFIYTKGATILEDILDEAILDTNAPSLIHLLNEPNREYSKADAKLEIVFNALDVNYHEAYTSLTKDDISIKIGDTVFTSVDTELSKNSIESGEQFKLTINKIPYHTESAELSIIILRDKIIDKALNGNIETTLNTGIKIVNSTITNNAPTLDLDVTSNDITVTCNQVTNFMPNDVTIIYEYRPVGETEFKKSESNIISGVLENTNYEIRTVLTDVTGNSVASEISAIKTVYLPVKVSFAVTNPESGLYVVGTNIEIAAQFNVNTVIENVPTLTIKFGEGNDILLNGIFDSAAKKITYNYTLTANDLGKLTGVNFSGSLVYAETLTKEYNDVPVIEGSEIYARTGAFLNNTGVYYPYVQDAINMATDNEENVIRLLLEEELTNTVIIEDIKNIVLDLNGKDLKINSGDAVTVENNGILTIVEGLGTGEICATGTETSIAIDNNGTLNILGGIIRSKLEGRETGSCAINNNGTLTIGNDDGTISTEIPYITGTEYGIKAESAIQTNLYDGIIEGSRSKSYQGVLNIPTGYDIITERVGDYREKTYISTDKIPPDITYTILTPGWQKEYVEIEVKVYDAESGVRRVTLDNNEVVLTNLKTTLRLYQNKEYILYVEDNASNSSSKSIIIDMIDKIPPRIMSLTASETDMDGIVELLIEAQDIDSGLGGVLLKEVDEMPTPEDVWNEIDTYPTSKQFISMQIEKNKIYYCFVKDRVGNITKYDEKIQIAFIDKVIPVIERVTIRKDEGKNYVSGKTVIVEINARDNIAVDEVLISDVDLTEDEARISSDWQKYNNEIVHKLPVSGDQLYTIYVWVKDTMGNLSVRQTASVKLKAFVVGDNPLDYTGNDKAYNKTSLRFRVKDYHFDFEDPITEEDIILRLSSGDKVLRNFKTGYTIKKISDYNGVIEKDFEYIGEVYELEVQNLTGTGNLSIVLLEGSHADLARNKVKSEVRLTDIFVDNNAPIIKVTNTGTYTNGYENKEVEVIDPEGYAVNAIEVQFNGKLETYALTNGKVRIPLLDGSIIKAYDKAGNEKRYEVGTGDNPTISLTNEADKNVKLQYGGTSKVIGFEYKGDGVIEVLSSDTNITNVALNTTNKTITLSPVNAGHAEVTLRVLKTDDYVEGKIVISVEVTPLPVELQWSNGIFDYNGRIQKVEATVQNAILGDIVIVNQYKENSKINAGYYTAEAISLDNTNYTVEGGTNITFDWQINKLDRTLTVDKTSLEIELPRVEKITFTYTGETADAIVTVSDSSVIEATVYNYENSGEIEVASLGRGTSSLTITIPESTNYNKAELTLGGSGEIEVILKVWLTYDVQGGHPIEGKWVVVGRPYGELPDAVLEGEKFAGWFVEPKGKGGRVTADTIVTKTDRHSIYACWNQAPEFQVYKVSSKTVNSITFTVQAFDADGDNVRYRIYVEGNLVSDSGYLPHSQSFTYTLTGLTEYTYYDYYIIADDTYEEKIGETLTVRTLCSGKGVTCYRPVYCKGYIDKQRTCTGGCGGDGWYTYTCTDGSRNRCSKCGGDGEISSTCSGGSSSTCSNCGGAGRCTGSFSRDGSVSWTCSCGGDVIETTYSCGWCGATKTTEKCNSCKSSSTSGGSHYKCSVCGGKGNVTSTCSHGKTSSHTITDTCSRCDGDGYIYDYCEHGEYRSHTQNDRCSTCGGDGIEDYKYRPCEHGNSSAHYYCATHGYNGSSSSHTHCVHGLMQQHDDLN